VVRSRRHQTLVPSRKIAVAPIIALILANILWGVNTPLLKMGIATIPVPIFVSLRFFVASMVLLPFAIRVWQPLKRKDLLLLTLASVLYISLSSWLLNIGLSKTTAINTAVINLLSPIILLILSIAFLKERLNIRTSLGIILALAGSVIIIGRPWEGLNNSSQLAGNLLVLLAAFGTAISIIISKPIIKELSSYQAAFMALFPGVIPIGIYAVSQWPKWNVQATSAKSFAALIGSTLAILSANFLFFYALRIKRAQDTGVYQYLSTIAAIVAAWFLLSERPSTKFLFGAALVFLGVYLAEFSKSRKIYLRPNS